MTIIKIILWLAVKLLKRYYRLTPTAGGPLEYKRQARIQKLLMS
jgi:hypothetical protein